VGLEGFRFSVVVGEWVRETREARRDFRRRRSFRTSDARRESAPRMTIATDNDGPRGRLGAARVPWGRGLETEACAERTTEVRARAGARSARERRDSRARRAAAPPATARLAENLAEDCAGAPEDEAHPPRTTAAARHARGARCIAAIAGVTRRFDAVTAIVSALRARVCADERVEVIRRADWPTADPESGNRSRWISIRTRVGLARRVPRPDDWPEKTSACRHCRQRRRTDPRRGSSFATRKEGSATARAPALSLAAQ
jgi:hypothetical protein